MTEKQSWDIGRLQERQNEIIDNAKKMETRMKNQELFKETTVQQLIVVFDKLKELQDGDKWIKRMFMTALVGTGFSAIGALIIWAFQN